MGEDFRGLRCTVDGDTREMHTTPFLFTVYQNKPPVSAADTKQAARQSKGEL